MKLIVYSRLDGAGKSTQIELIKLNFLKKNKKCFTFWSGGSYTPNFQNIKNLIRFIFNNQLPKPGPNKQRTNAFSNPFIRKIWLTLAIVDLIYYYVFYLRFMKFINYNIICDRYIVDTQIDFILNYPNDNFQNWFVWKLLIKLALRPDYHFILVISTLTSKNRSLKKNEPSPDSSNTLDKRLDKYINYSKLNRHCHLLSCEQSIIKVSDDINFILNS